MTSQASEENEVLYLLQGGGALGAYQVGVCQALLEKGCQPNWIIGTSIGAINAAIIAGNKPAVRLEKLLSFWDLISSSSIKYGWEAENPMTRKMQNFFSSQQAVLMGQTGFFSPKGFEPWLIDHTTPDKISFYDTQELKKTLENLVDFDYLNQGEVRLTLSAMCLNDGILEEFDNKDMVITPEHVMASGALPPGFPAVKINDQYYWDAGISSNTPLMSLLGGNESKKRVCFMIDLFSNREDIPHNMVEVLKRKKDIEFSSRYHKMLHYFCQFYRLHSAIANLCQDMPEVAQHPALQGMNITMPGILKIVRFHYHDQPYDLWSKDFDFSKQSIEERRQAGYQEAHQALEEAPWNHDHLDFPNGVRLYEYSHLFTDGD